MTPELFKLNETIKAIVDRAGVLLIGRQAIIHDPNAGKYMGRSGEITAISLERDGIYALVMVYRKDTKRHLNGDSKTRSYWPVKDLTIW